MKKINKKYRIEMQITGSQVFLIEADNEKEAIENIKNNPEEYIIIENIENNWEQINIRKE